MNSAREALIVAIADYRDPRLQRLRAPAADADALGKILADAAIGGFRVELSLDEDETKLTRRLARFFADRRPDDLLLVHFSCHGIKDASGELYLAAADTETDLLSATGIPSRWLNEQIDQCRSKRIVVLLDCCFSGSFPFGVRIRAGDQVNVQQHLLGRGRVVITASNAMEYSFEGEQLSGAGQPSIFTKAVVEGLETGQADRDGDRRVSVDELYEYVYDRVRETNPNQSPTKMSSLEGPLYIARSSYERPVEPVPLPQELVDLAQHPYPGARLSAIDELSAMLISENRGVALSARLTLERLINDDSRRVSERAQEVLRSHSASVESTAPAPDVADVEGARGSVQAPEGGSTTEREPEVLASAPPAKREPVEEPERPDNGELGHPPPPAVAPELHAAEPGAPVESISGREAGSNTDWSNTVAVRTITSRESVRLAGPTAVHVGGAAAMTGAIAVLASLPGGGPNQDNVGYWLPVAVMSAGVIVLIGYALRSNRRAPLIGGTGLALALLGVTFPLSWHVDSTFQFPRTAPFWLGACGAALAALGAALASWQMYAEPSGRPREPTATWSRAARVLLTMPGPLIVIASLLFLDEWSGGGLPEKPAWQNATDSIKRYPSAMILLCAFVVALAAAGIRSNRTRLVVIAAGVACFVLGESVPLIFTGAGHWGPGRNLAIAGAVLAVAGLALAAARSGDAVPQRPRGDQPRP